MYMNNHLISIIIPAFNVEKFIINSVSSVLEQTHKNIEIIIINDGSTDNTLDIITKLAGKHKNIFFLSQENKGISSARNLGLSKATGDYVAFLDSDDFIEPTFIESMLKKTTKDNNIVFCLNKTINKNNKVTFSNNYTNMDDIAINYMNFDYFDICCMLIKRSFLLNDNLIFNEKLIVGEDVLFILMCICKTGFSCVPEYLYNYIYRGDSIMNKKWILKDYINEIQAWDTIYHEMNINYHKKNRKDFMGKIASKILSLKISFMWKLLISGKNHELSNFISTLSYPNQGTFPLKKKELLRLKVIMSKNKMVWFLIRLFFTKRKNIIQ
ncbi:glycosyltransferase [Xenorhabdus bovienii]|uniref:glycosyltransferase family 2 protein n=1 Tax=Xenorhabdus bovienii TaxID=40576 RepID=UPI001EDE64B2|nr:glycosyltransferase family 2 protein [Xenorhabdus bovienii]MCG3461361.1 glycosyltransferase [Xenorhabdus bovienii]